MNESPILKNVKCMDRHPRLINNVIRIPPTTNRQGASLTNMVIQPNYNKAMAERNVANDFSQ
jgi:hypothetical protein